MLAVLRGAFSHTCTLFQRVPKMFPVKSKEFHHLHSIPQKLRPDNSRICKGVTMTLITTNGA